MQTTTSTMTRNLVVATLIAKSEDQIKALVDVVNSFVTADRQLVETIRQARIEGVGSNVSLPSCSEFEAKLQTLLIEEFKSGVINPVTIDLYLGYVRSRIGSFGHNLAALVTPANTTVTLHPTAWTALLEKFEGWQQATMRLFNTLHEIELESEISFPSVPAYLTETYSTVIAAMKSGNIVALRPAFGSYMVQWATFMAYVNQAIEMYMINTMQIDGDEANNG